MNHDKNEEHQNEEHQLQDLWVRFHLGMLLSLLLVIGISAIVIVASCRSSPKKLGDQEAPEPPIILPSSTALPSRTTDDPDLLEIIVSLVASAPQINADMGMALEAMWALAEPDTDLSSFQHDTELVALSKVRLTESGPCTTETLRSAEPIMTSMDLVQAQPGFLLAYTYKHTPSDSHFVVLLRRGKETAKTTVVAVCATPPGPNTQ